MGKPVNLKMSTTEKEVMQDEASLEEKSHYTADVQYPVNCRE